MDAPIEMVTSDAAYRQPEPDRNTHQPSSRAVSNPSGSKGAIGRSMGPLHGTAYHIRMTMAVLFRAYKLYREGHLPRFELRLEDATAGKFDDLVICYSTPSIPEGTVYIQAKHKQIPEGKKSSKAKKRNPNYPFTPTPKKGPALTIGSVLTKWSSNGPFSIPMYFISYLEGCEKFSTATHTFLLCTNLPIDTKLKECGTLQKHECSDLLYFCNDIGATCYSFSCAKDFTNLTDELRRASLEKLGQMIVLHVMHQTDIKCNYSSLNVYADLIAKCVVENEPGKYKLSETFLTASDSSVMGQLRTALKSEYSRLILKNAKQSDLCMKWKEMQIGIDKAFFELITNDPSDPSDAEESTYYATVDRVIKQFCEQFLLVCGSSTGEQLLHNVFDLMPSWVSDKQTTHNQLFEKLFDAMKQDEPVAINCETVKRMFLRMRTNQEYSRFQFNSELNVTLWRTKFSDIIVNTARLEESELYEFLTDDSVYDRIRYYTTTNIKAFAIIISQTVALLQREALFLHYASEDFDDNIFDILRNVFEFMEQLEVSNCTIFITANQSEKSLMKEIQRYSKMYKTKFVIIEQQDSIHLYDNTLCVHDLTEESRERLYEDRLQQTLNVLDTSISLSEIVHPNDSLSFLCHVLDDADSIGEMKSTLSNKDSFDMIQSWYIPRTIVAIEDAEEQQLDKNEEIFHSTYYADNNISFDDFWFKSAEASPVLRSVIMSETQEDCYLPDVFTNDNQPTAHIVLDEAGSGKSTYFTWLSARLSQTDPLLWVIRVNAMQYCTDYKRFQITDPNRLDETAVIRILYRLIHLTCFVTNVYSQTIQKTDVERDRADQASELLTVCGGKVVVDKDKANQSRLTLGQLIELRVFQEKYNGKQLILLVDGLDETAPFYVEFLKTCLAKLVSMKGIRNLYLSTRPYDYKQDLQTKFPNSSMYRLKVFSRSEQLRYLNSYFVQRLNDYKQCNVSDRIKVLGKLYYTIKESLGNLKAIPLFLHMACVMHVPIIKRHVNFQRRTISKTLFSKTNIELLQLIENFIDEKLKILTVQKGGTPQSALENVVQIITNKAFYKNIKKRHILSALLVMFDRKQREALMTPQELKEANASTEQITSGIEKTGMINTVLGDTPQFMHRIFVEYFVACWMHGCMDRVMHQSFFRSWTFWHPNFYQVRNFFNRIIVKNSQGCEMHMAVMNESIRQIGEILSNNPSAAFVRDAVGRLPLHLAALYPAVEGLNSLIDHMSIESINAKDQLLQWSALDYAFAGRYDRTIKSILAAGATVNLHTLIQQILSNDLKQLLFSAHLYGTYLQAHKASANMAQLLHIQVVEYLLNDMQLDIFVGKDELESLTVIEFCVKENMLDLFKQLASQNNYLSQIICKEFEHLLSLAFDNNAYSFFIYFIMEHKVTLSHITNREKLIAALKYTIQNKLMHPFELIFQQLCMQSNIVLLEEANIPDGSGAVLCHNMPPLDKHLYPKKCCKRNIRNYLHAGPEQDIEHILHNGCIVEALLATAIHEENIQVFLYILHKTNLTITNKLIVTIVELLPKGRNVFHEQSFPAFQYLIDNSTDLHAVDEDGRNLLHVTAQSGCFFMFHCLISKGFDPNAINFRNGWNVFHYVTFNADDDQSDKTLEYLLKHCNMVWFDLFDKFIEMDGATENEILSTAIDQNYASSKKLSKRQYALLAWYVLLERPERPMLLTDQDQEEALQIIREISAGNVQSRIITKAQDDIPQFANQLFVEYLAAQWMYENKHRLKDESYFRSSSFWYLYRMWDLFNRIILRESKGCDVHIAIINQSPQQVLELLMKNPLAVLTKDAIGRYPLQLAAMYPLEILLDLLIPLMPFPYFDDKDDFLQWSALDYTFAMRIPANTRKLLAAGAEVDQHVLLQQIYSNKLVELLFNTYHYTQWLQSHERSQSMANHIRTQVVEHLMNEKCIDIFAQLAELDSQSVVEYCVKQNMLDMFQQFVSQICDPSKISEQNYADLLELAFQTKAYDIIAYCIDLFRFPFPHINDTAGLIAAVKYTIQKRCMHSFKIIFQQLCIQLNISLIEDTNYPDEHCVLPHQQLSPPEKNLHPIICCVHNVTNADLTMPQYDAKDVLHEGYVVEALLAVAVQEKNLQVLRYILYRSNLTITNKLIVLIMRLLPKGKDICHKSLMFEFQYLLDNSTDLHTSDNEGRNLLHVTAQSGCFFMLHFLIARGFDPNEVNSRNGWNVFHYVAFSEDDDRSDKMLEYLLKHCNMVWFDLFDGFLGSDGAMDTAPRKLSCRQLALLACYALLMEEDRALLLPDQYILEALHCIDNIAKGNIKSEIIKDVQNGMPQFTHRIFLEYLAAWWMYDHRHNISKHSFYRSWKFWNKSFHRLRYLFNRIVFKASEGCDIHVAVINQSMQQICEIVSINPSVVTAQDAFGRMPLHLAVTYPSVEVVNLLLNKMSHKSINAKDQFLQWSALDYAFAYRSPSKIKKILTCKATIDQHILLQQILSNGLKQLLLGAHKYGKFLHTHESSVKITKELTIEVVKYLQNEKQLNIFTQINDLDSLSVLQFCAKHNIFDIFQTLVSTVQYPLQMLSKDFYQLLELAFESNAYDIIAYSIEVFKMPLSNINNVSGLIAAVKYTIQNTQMHPFQILLQQLCTVMNIPMVENTDIFEEPSIQYDLTPLDNQLYPKICCVRNTTNEHLSLPAYDATDVQHESYAIDALLAVAVQEGNIQMLQYILRKTNMTVSNALIVMIMGLLSTEDDVCHAKSIPAFRYLLDHSTDLRTIDRKGRNLLHLTAQSGCFFMLHCLIAKGFDPNAVNSINGWNMFHYVAFSEDDDRSDKALEYLLKHCNMIWFELLDNILFPNDITLSDTSCKSNVNNDIISELKPN
ncbi:uncharacterized protein LOC133393181 [Anopheles gambiae]|uniref:uncharacterized protein LOC133393181 n=1 Tax=Anopheles gambiae TaxID=7165 RepID=UPI002AC9004C|nr:uncharacterized protein LOC133393181 [Anopheles gambiae]